jgi:hypothetical protein
MIDHFGLARAIPELTWADNPPPVEGSLFRLARGAEVKIKLPGFQARKF